MAAHGRAERIAVARVETALHRAPVAVPVRTSFGVMHDRPALFVRLTDTDGATGYGEIWCNFPSVGAEHRRNLAEQVVGPLLLAAGPQAPGGCFARLMERLAVLAIQSGEWGPLRHVAAGLDAALHDLAARRAGLPLFRLLAPEAAPEIAAYASGIGPEDPARAAAGAQAAGHTAFKLKVGFGRDTDRAALRAIRAAIGPRARLMADANQGWEPAEARRLIADYAGFDLAWVEEPIRADRPLAEWAALAGAVPVPLAAGENVSTEADFDALIECRAVGYLQPDVAKWGGVSGCLAVARRAAAAGLVYCPHFLGGGLGLLASAHVLAAAGGDGLLEIDSNPNPLRESLAGPLLAVDRGRVRLAETPGIGIEPDHLFA
ncbi:mandelate racemase/muconate lactonizing enzyme family protein [Aquibium sp. A9E412]|uniref:mandelate racemase/muconate lactonizing enzyme family protein n=1 Tax=Aquibium sp. A9E412 TaxID=2976767 RepID=UPI0025B10BCA|nr:mandelate racemase/muconate lactonizing enzyme family protein [Aquibium sp. A9E412]MDN2564859.1 mandelate racemase/muconate lactonizing enzyme family protein [Aquibium sp. A9E412]